MACAAASTRAQVKKEMSGWLAEGLKAMLTPPDE